MPPVAGSKAVCGYDGVPERQLRHPLDLFLCGAPVKNLKKESQWRRPQSTAWKPKTRQMKKKNETTTVQFAYKLVASPDTPRPSAR